MAQTYNAQPQQANDEEVPKINYSKLNKYLRASVERDLVDVPYIIHDATITILLGNIDAADAVATQKLFKNNYTALMSFIGLEHVNVELDLGFLVVPLTLRLLKALSGLEI